MEIKSYKTYYKIDGAKYDRVTSIIGYFITQDLLDKAFKKGVAQWKKDSKMAMQIGTRVDGLIQTYLKTGHYYLTPNDGVSIKNAMSAFIRWIDTEKPTIEAYQTTLRNDEYRIAGTLDLKLPNTIVDVKVAAAIYPHYWLQVAAYAWLFSGDYEGMKVAGTIDKIGILRLDKLIGEYEYKVIDYDSRLTALFIGLLAYYRFLQGYKNKRKKEDSYESAITNTEIPDKLGIFKPKAGNNWTEWHRQV